MALASAETELNAALKGACELLGVTTMLEEAGIRTGATLEGDSAACKGVLSRQGSGRIKHLEVRQLWLQSCIKQGRLEYNKICRTMNSADSQAKHWASEGATHFKRMGFRCMSH